jgi:hypothetical protein
MKAITVDAAARTPAARMAPQEVAGGSRMWVARSEAESRSRAASGRTSTTISSMASAAVWAAIASAVSWARRRCAPAIITTDSRGRLIASPRESGLACELAS